MSESGGVGPPLDSFLYWARPGRARTATVASKFSQTVRRPSEAAVRCSALVKPLVNHLFRESATAVTWVENTLTPADEKGNKVLQRTANYALTTQMACAGHSG